MAEAEKDLTRVMLKDVRLSYPALWKPKGFGKKNEGEPAYQATFLIDKGTKAGKNMIADIEDAIEEAKERQWGNKIPKIKSDKICFKDGDGDDEDTPETEGMMILSSRNYKKIRVLDADKLDVQDGDEGAPYAGCYVDAIVRLWAQDNDYGIRINCSLEAVRFRRDGEAFGAAPVNVDDFEDIEREGRSERRSRSSRDDRDSRDERDDRGSREDRSERSSSRDDRDRGGREERGSREDRSERSSREDRSERAGREDRSERAGRDDRDRGGRDERDDRPRRASRDDAQDRPSRNSRSGSRDDGDVV